MYAINEFCRSHNQTCFSPEEKNRNEVEADKFETSAADFGFFNPEFIKSLERAEKKLPAGESKKHSLFG